MLALFLGGLGIHWFYLGRPWRGFAYLALCWTGIPTILALIDFVVILVTKVGTFDAKYNK